RLPRRVGHPRTHAAIVVAAAGRVGGSTRRGHRGHGRGTPRGSGGCATVASTDRPVDEGPRWVVGGVPGDSHADRAEYAPFDADTPLLAALRRSLGHRHRAGGTRVAAVRTRRSRVTRLAARARRGTRGDDDRRPVVQRPAARRVRQLDETLRGRSGRGDITDHYGTLSITRHAHSSAIPTAPGMRSTGPRRLVPAAQPRVAELPMLRRRSGPILVCATVSESHSAASRSSSAATTALPVATSGTITSPIRPSGAINTIRAPARPRLCTTTFTGLPWDSTKSRAICRA